MKPLKKLWDITPAVIIGKKVHQSVKSREKKPKKEKRLSVTGTYFSSHPGIHGYRALRLEFGEDGIYVYEAYNRKTRDSVIEQFKWDEITGYGNEIEDKTQLQTTQRLTITRMATLGVFSLAAPKKSTKGSIHEKYFDVLKTTTGNIELESEINSGSAGGSMGDLNRNMAQISVNQRTANIQNIKRFVNEHLVRQ